MAVMQKKNDLKYKNEIASFVDWCEKNFLILNIKKTKLIVDFRQKKHHMNPIVINEKEVIIAETYKYQSTEIDNKMKGSENIAKMAKKANQMVYFVR